jgi:hypothetical protein
MLLPSRRRWVLKLECVELPEQTVDAPAHLFALGTQSAQFFFEVVDVGRLLVQLTFGLGSAFFSGGSRLALAAHNFDSAQDALFKGRKIVNTHREYTGLDGLVMCFRGRVPFPV